MILLPFSCYCTELKVVPNNWANKNSSIKKDWYIYYRFYDPNYKEHPKFKQGKLVVIKRMNQFKTILERQESTRTIILQELEKLKIRAFNPITSKNLQDDSLELDIEPSTPFCKALLMAEKRISASPTTKRDLKSILKFVSNSATQLGYSDIPIKSISRKHLKQLLAHIEMVYGESAHRYNKIRSYLMILFNELVELEACEINPIRDLSKKKSIQRVRNLPNIENRETINKYLQQNHYRFWLFMHIFFHSGARLTEIMKVKRTDVNLSNQSFKITIQKGTINKEVIRPIKKIALPYWEEAIFSASSDDYIFSKGLEPGKEPIQSYQITKRWNRHIKKKLGIKEDFYSLKHLNLDQTAEILGIADASQMASHTSTEITTKYYAIGEKQRQIERLKNIENKFA